ncbi:Na+/H+ antiporter subunit E [Nitrincola tapanii]|nr:Na+/H+ antiporter subunit E [Nitrincola tapanii]
MPSVSHRPSASQTRRKRSDPFAFLLRLLLALLFWSLLSEGALSAWLLGLPACLLAAWLSLRLSPTPETADPMQSARLCLFALPSFLLYFVQASCVAGLDIARRTLDPKLPLHPSVFTYPTELSGLPLWCLMGVISLLPGTLSLNWQPNCLEIHCLDQPDKAAAELVQVENRIRRLFTLPLLQLPLLDRSRS